MDKRVLYTANQICSLDECRGIYLQIYISEKFCWIEEDLSAQFNIFQEEE